VLLQIYESFRKENGTEAQHSSQEHLADGPRTAGDSGAEPSS
jgi:hypothetical protein